MLDVKKLYYVNCKNPALAVDRDFFAYGPLPLLWHFEGLYRLVPVEVITNILQLLKPNDFGRIFWDQSIPVPREIGDQLTNKQFDHDTDEGEG
jgi:hypothetical protein